MPQLMNSTNKQQPQGQPVMGNPLELFNMLAGAQGNLPEQKAAKADLAKQEQTQQVRSAYDAGKASNPNTSGTMLLKDILDKYKAMQGIEAIAQGVPYNQVLEQSLNEELKFNDYQTKIVQSLQGGQAPQPVQELRPIVVNGQKQPQQAMAAGQPQQAVAGGQFGQEATNLMQEPRGILQGILQGFAQGTGYTGGRLDNLQKAQKLAGQEPIQAGEKEKLDIAGANSIAVENLKQANELAKANKLTPETLFTKFEAASQPFITLRDAFSRIESFSDKIESATPIDDVSILYQYIKMLDPTSTVRESEIATVENAKGVSQKILDSYNSAIKGNKLSTSQRRNIFQQSRNLFKSAEENAVKTSKEFAKLGKASGIDPKTFIRDTGLSQKAEEGFLTTPSGIKYKEVK